MAPVSSPVNVRMPGANRLRRFAKVSSLTRMTTRMRERILMRMPAQSLSASASIAIAKKRHNWTKTIWSSSGSNLGKSQSLSHRCDPISTSPQSVTFPAC
jgi:hypothetical protein